MPEKTVKDKAAKTAPDTDGFWGPAKAVFEKDGRKAMYKPTMNPHLLMIRLNKKDEEGIFQCQACKTIGTLDGLGSTVCPVVSTACVNCGLTPICAEDCEGIAEAFKNYTDQQVKH